MPRVVRCPSCETRGTQIDHGVAPPLYPCAERRRLTVDEANSSGPLDATEVRRRAASGAAVLGARGAIVYTLAVGANLVLAGLLDPRDFGIVALGSVLIVAGVHLGDVGFGAPLIRREADPLRVELEAVNGLQLALTGLIAIAAAAAAPAFGRDGAIVALMAASLPITVLRAPSVIVLERRLAYRVIATTDVVEAVAYYLWAVVAVAIGFGVWGLASAVVVRAIAGTATMAVVGPLGLLRPRWSWRHVRPMLGFGAKFQAAMVVTLVRVQGLNVLVAAVAGVATLGDGTRVGASSRSHRAPGRGQPRHVPRDVAALEPKPIHGRRSSAPWRPSRAITGAVCVAVVFGSGPPDAHRRRLGRCPGPAPLVGGRESRRARRPAW